MIGPHVLEAQRLPAWSLPIPGLGIGSSITKDLAKAIFDGLSSWVVGGAVWLVRHVIGLIGPTTRVQLSARWFVGRVSAMRNVALLVSTPMVAVATLGAVIRQDGRRLVRIFAVGLPVAFVAGAAGTLLVGTALDVTDELCAAIDPHGRAEALDQVAHSLGAAGIPAFVQLLVAGLVILGSIALWLELVLRATAIYIAVFFFPLGLAALIWPATSAVAKRFVEVLGALIASKFVIAATLSLGAAAIVAQHASIDQIITGTAVLLLAAFAPFVVLRLVPLVEFAAVGHLEGTARRPLRFATGPGLGAAGTGREAAGRAAEGDSGGLAAEPVAPTAVAMHAGEWRPGGPQSGGAAATGGAVAGTATAGTATAGTAVAGTAVAAAGSTTRSAVAHAASVTRTEPDPPPGGTAVPADPSPEPSWWRFPEPSGD